MAGHMVKDMRSKANIKGQTFAKAACRGRNQAFSGYLLKPFLAGEPICIGYTIEDKYVEVW